MLAIYIDSIGDKSATYKLLRNFSSLPLSLIQSRIKFMIQLWMWIF